MGLDANIITIGRFKKELAEAECLTYPSDYYIKTKEGYIVTSELLRCNTSSQSRNLAFALGFDPWEFDKHYIEKPTMEIIERLEKYFCETDEDYEQTRILKRLIENGFVIIYLPNG